MFINPLLGESPMKRHDEKSPSKASSSPEIERAFARVMKEILRVEQHLAASAEGAHSRGRSKKGGRS
jgi:hypothetical protein